MTSSYARKVKSWYETGKWKRAWVVEAYEKGKITAEELAWIIGEAD